MFIYDTVENTSIEELHSTFLEAFSDYQVKMELPLLKLQQMLKRTGYVAKASIGAFEENVLVGFLLNAVRQWNGKLTAYDTGTAVIPDYRNHGITSNMFLYAKELLKKMQVKQYLLEVIQSNTSAVNLYKKQGFEILREFEAKLICASMEEECGIPKDYFDYVYSVYGIGWTTDLVGTFKRIASYLKKDGVFISLQKRRKCFQ